MSSLMVALTCLAALLLIGYGVPTLLVAASIAVVAVWAYRAGRRTQQAATRRVIGS